MKWAALQWLGLVVLAAAVAKLDLWAGLIVLGLGMILAGMAAEMGAVKRG